MRSATRFVILVLSCLGIWPDQASAFPSSDEIGEGTVLPISAAADLAADDTAFCECESQCNCSAEHICLNRWLSESSVLPECNFVDHIFTSLLAPKDKLGFPVSIAAWHWWPIDTTGLGRGGYGYQNFRGTYAYTVSATPEYDLGCGNRIGGSVLFAGRDDQFYRTFYSRRFWFLSGHVYFANEEWGTLRAGLVDTKFGLDNYLGFIGTAPYFDGFIQDPDYGVSWERTREVSECLTVETVAQYFIHDGEWNGSLRNHDQESVSGIHERNTFVGRVSPTWTIDDDTRLTLGASALVGEIDSSRPTFVTDARAVWGMHSIYAQGPLELRGEVLQWFGKSVPTRFASGGPSNRVTSFTTEAGYQVGPVKYRGQYSASFDSNPHGRQNIWSLGGVIQLTPHVTLWAEYAEWTVDGNATFGDFTVLEGPQFTLYWQY